MHRRRSFCHLPQVQRFAQGQNVSSEKIAVSSSRTWRFDERDKQHVCIQLIKSTLVCAYRVSLVLLARNDEFGFPSMDFVQPRWALELVRQVDVSHVKMQSLIVQTELPWIHWSYLHYTHFRPVQSKCNTSRSHRDRLRLWASVRRRGIEFLQSNDLSLIYFLFDSDDRLPSANVKLFAWSNARRRLSNRFHLCTDCQRFVWSMTSINIPRRVKCE